MRELAGHKSRVGALAWRDSVLTSGLTFLPQLQASSHCGLSAGSRDRVIYNRDTRDPAVSHKMVGHRQEVCGLEWSSDCQFLASGTVFVKVQLLLHMC